jgi:hypothetical protein
MTTDIRHRSKIGLEILIPCAVVLSLVMGIMLINRIWVGLVIVAGVSALLIHVYLNTYYTISSTGKLKVRCGMLEKFEIDIRDIVWIKPTKELTNAPALSTDRLEINYTTGRVLVSPKDKSKFISDLRSFNPEI